MNLRRTIATLLAALMLLALTACGAGTTPPAQDANAPAEETAPSTTESSQFRVGMECAEQLAGERRDRHQRSRGKRRRRLRRGL